jgi:SAM-dependent methyltransferase
MGLDINSVRLLIAAHKQGVRFDKVLTIGRLWLNVYPQKMARLLQEHGLPAQEFTRAGPECAFSEPFFRALGASKVAALDYSDYEGAEIVHDLNEPIPAALNEQFDVVFDGGTLEHVFHFPIALRSCMEMVRPGGRLFLHTTLNNTCGHGFYQFSPELFYRALSPQNGFAVERMIAHMVGPYGRWFDVADPEKIRSRVELISFVPMLLLLQARKDKTAPIFEKPPLQSDYTVAWQGGKQRANAGVRLAAKLGKVVPGVARFINAVSHGLEFYHRQSLRNRRFFRPVRKR